MADAKAKAQSLIDQDSTVVFSKSYCPHCKATKNTLTNKKAKFALYELDQLPDGSDLQDALEEITGQRSVPNIFIGQKHIGGNSELQALGSSLDAQLKQAGALQG